jgi:hypothetical protein
MALESLVPLAVAWRVNALRARFARIADRRAASRAARGLSPRASRILQDLKAAVKVGSAP